MRSPFFVMRNHSAAIQSEEEETVFIYYSISVKEHFYFTEQTLAFKIDWVLFQINALLYFQWDDTGAFFSSLSSDSALV